MAKKEIKNYNVSSQQNQKNNQNNFNSAPKKIVDKEQAMMENFVALQRVMTNLTISIDNLSKRISRLLELFETSAKTLAEKDFGSDNRNSKEIKEKLDGISEQNKILARGLTLLHEKGNSSDDNGNNESPNSANEAPSPRKMESDGYQRSISQNSNI
jgi:hypothetical protein